ncbi:MAG TPA: hypothetical protein VE173_16135 [Longimicrobiales bacterium]|nr:hypothetical protein [Longimicrobiales bacterium]
MPTLLPVSALLVVGCGSPSGPHVPILDGPWSGETVLDGTSYLVRMELETAGQTSGVSFNMKGEGTLVVEGAESPFQVTGDYGHRSGWSFDFSFVVSGAETYGYEGVIPSDERLQGTLSRQPQGASAFLLMTPSR